jgi:hypothetical protein
VLRVHVVVIVSYRGSARSSIETLELAMNPERSTVARILRDAFWGVLLIAAVALVFAFDSRSLPQAGLSSNGSLLDASGSRPAATTDRALSGSIPAEQSVQAASDQPSDQIAAEAPDVAKPSEAPLPAFVTERPVPKPEQQVEFFSVKAHAESVAFVVDCSSSMQGRRFERARTELATAVSKLRPDQLVFVVFFNDGPVSLFQDGRPPQLGAASPLAKCDFISRMAFVEANGGTNPEPALAIAARLNPDVIYLLSDGEFQPLNTRTLKLLTHQKITVHTIAFESPEGERTLRQISNATGGAHRFEPANDTADTSYPELVAGLADELVEQLVRADTDLRQEIRKRLVQMAGGIDHGPARGASDAGLDQAVTRWRQWSRKVWVPIIGARDLQGVIDALRGDKPSPRWAAARVAGQRQLPVATNLIDLLEHCDDVPTAAEAHAALMQLAGSDYGPSDSASDLERARAAGRWRKWLGSQEMLRNLTPLPESEIVAAFRDSDPARRWAAVAVARKRKLKAVGEFFAVLNDSDLDVRHEGGQALVDLALATDLGPCLPDDAHRFIPDGFIDLLTGSDPAQAAEAANCLEQIASKAPRTGRVAASSDSTRAVSPEFWNKWWAQEKEDRAAKSFALAKQLHDQGRTDAANARFKVLIEKFPGTAVAVNAKRLMEMK